MNKKDIIYSLICGLAVAFIAADFFKEYTIWFFITLPLLAVAGLWVFDFVSVKITSLRQIGRFCLVGAFADVVDIKVFQFLFLFIPLPMILKTASFIVATLIKYWINKFWAFEKNEKTGLNKEIVKFFAVTVVGLLFNLCIFYFFINIVGAQFSLSKDLWAELSIVFSALGAAVVNFLGYKFAVFKK